MGVMDKKVYFIDDGRGAIKIGISDHPPSRVHTIQRYHAVEIRLLATTPGAHRRENELHEMFAHIQLKGEWFLKTQELLEFIADLNPEIDVEAELSTANTLAEPILLGAKREAELILDEARREAERCVRDAGEQANRIVRAAEKAMRDAKLKARLLLHGMAQDVRLSELSAKRAGDQLKAYLDAEKDDTRPHGLDSDDTRKLDSRIQEMLAAGYSQRQTEIGVFGYAGGRAHREVKRAAALLAGDRRGGGGQDHGLWLDDKWQVHKSGQTETEQD